MNERQKLIEAYPIDWPQAKIEAFRRDLLAWYDQHKRDLPWRRTKNPYYIWISEIMLQQTQVDTVIPYFERFIDQLPTVQDLAQVDEDLLLCLWQGLGYYSRARSLKIAAQDIVSRFDGQLPDNIHDLKSLRGIGPYTAGAIASIAYKQPEPAVDGNALRVISRIFEIDLDISKTKNHKVFSAILYQLIDPDRPGDFNQAIMDLGATIMTPTNYQAEESPVKDYDQSYLKGTAHLYPVKQGKLKNLPQEILAYVMIDESDRWLMRKHQADQLLHGLWHFPMAAVDLVLESASSQEVLEPLLDLLDKAEGIAWKEGTDLDEGLFSQRLDLQTDPVKHVFSHRTWYVDLIPLSIPSQAIEISDSDQWLWVDSQTLNRLALSRLQEKLIQKIAIDYQDDFN